MDEYIKREKALDCFSCDLGKKDYLVSYQGFMTEAAFRINDIPAADVRPVVKGTWIKPTRVPDSMLDECSVCGFDTGAYTFNYCPNCGADMREES